MPTVELTKRAAKELESLDRQFKEQIKETLRALAFGSVKTFPLSGELKGLFKARSGNYRIIFQKLSPARFLILFIRHRRDAYR